MVAIPPAYKRAAYCDVDGTLAATNIVGPLVWLKKHTVPAPWNWLWLSSMVVRGPWWMFLDRCNRNWSNRAIYSNYRNLSVMAVKNLAEACYAGVIKPKLFSAALHFVEELKEQGVRPVLITGGIDLFMQPLAVELGADLLAPGLEENGGVFTGRLLSPPYAGEKKAEIIRLHAAQHGIDLSRSLALGDSEADLPMLRTVGRPIATNPDSRLRREAQKQGWDIKQWR
jgi:HAD superfamily hydrolase (TIGR01490 family)